jgi:RNA polymerase sigma-54 factor
VDIIEILRVNSGSIHSLDDTEIHKLAYLVGLEKKSLIQKLDILRSLQMFPIASIDNRETQRIIPEVFYFNSGNTVNISIRSTFLPELSLNTELLSYGREQLNHEWLERYEQAKNLLKSIDYRYSTLTQVAEAILIRQQAFFIHGESALVPLRQQEVAEMVGIHVSTVSRIITSKYCDTKWGIFPLRYFFPSAIARERGDVTVLQLKKDITTALASEDSGAPLSDSQLQTKLQQAGYKIERRTVAKYRKLLHILSAKQRKAINSK